MPGTPVVVNALAAIGHKSMQIVTSGFVPGSGHDQDERAGIEWDESLATQGVMLHMIDPAWHLELPAVDQADNRVCIVTCELDIGKCMIAVRHAVINREKISLFIFDHIPEGRKGLAAQGQNLEGVSHLSFPLSGYD
jgi:hypothetical protein